MSEELEVEHSISGTSDQWINEDPPRISERELRGAPQSFWRNMIRLSRRRRKRSVTNSKAAHVRSQGKKSSSFQPSSTTQFADQIGRTGELVLEGLMKGTNFVAAYIINLAVNTLQYLRQPLAIFMCFYVLTFITGYISESFYRTLSPICTIPGLSSLPVCQLTVISKADSSAAASSPAGAIPRLADYLTLMNTQSKSFEQLLRESAAGSSLSVEIKMAEMASLDLMTRVQITGSNLNTRGGLTTYLGMFIDDARKTARRLQRLTSKINGAVDHIMAVNDHSLRLIESERAKDLSSWMSPAHLVLWDVRDQQKHNAEAITQVFYRAMNMLSVNMERLMLEVEHSLQDLNDLEGKLATLHEIIVREDSLISSAKSDLIEDLWTRLGGNRKSLKSLDNHLVLLQGLASYREQALVHVVSTAQTLQALSEDMEDIRERVAAPSDLIGAEVPVEVHINSIQTGLGRLRDGPVRARKLVTDAVRRALEENRSGTLL